MKKKEKISLYPKIDWNNLYNEDNEKQARNYLDKKTKKILENKSLNCSPRNNNFFMYNINKNQGSFQKNYFKDFLNDESKKNICLESENCSSPKTNNYYELLNQKINSNENIIKKTAINLNRKNNFKKELKEIEKLKKVKPRKMLTLGNVINFKTLNTDIKEEETSELKNKIKVINMNDDYNNFFIDSNCGTMQNNQKIDNEIINNKEKRNIELKKLTIQTDEDNVYEYRFVKRKKKITDKNILTERSKESSIKKKEKALKNKNIYKKTDLPENKEIIKNDKIKDMRIKFKNNQNEKKIKNNFSLYQSPNKIMKDKNLIYTKKKLINEIEDEYINDKTDILSNINPIQDKEKTRFYSRLCLKFSKNNINNGNIDLTGHEKDIYKKTIFSPEEREKNNEYKTLENKNIIERISVNTKRPNILQRFKKDYPKGSLSLGKDKEQSETLNSNEYIISFEPKKQIIQGKESRNTEEGKYRESLSILSGGLSHYKNGVLYYRSPLKNKINKENIGKSLKNHFQIRHNRSIESPYKKVKYSKRESCISANNPQKTLSKIDIEYINYEHLYSKENKREENCLSKERSNTIINQSSALSPIKHDENNIGEINNRIFIDEKLKNNLLNNNKIKDTFSDRNTLSPSKHLNINQTNLISIESEQLINSCYDYSNKNPSSIIDKLNSGVMTVNNNTSSLNSLSGNNSSINIYLAQKEKSNIFPSEKNENFLVFPNNYGSFNKNSIPYSSNSVDYNKKINNFGKCMADKPEEKTKNINDKKNKNSINNNLRESTKYTKGKLIRKENVEEQSTIVFHPNYNINNRNSSIINYHKTSIESSKINTIQNKEKNKNNFNIKIKNYFSRSSSKKDKPLSISLNNKNNIEYSPGVYRKPYQMYSQLAKTDKRQKKLYIKKSIFEEHSYSSGKLPSVSINDLTLKRKNIYLINTYARKKYQTKDFTGIYNNRKRKNMSNNLLTGSLEFFSSDFNELSEDAKMKHTVVNCPSFCRKIYNYPIKIPDKKNCFFTRNNRIYQKYKENKNKKGEFILLFSPKANVKKEQSKLADEVPLTALDKKEKKISNNSKKTIKTRNENDIIIVSDKSISNKGVEDQKKNFCRDPYVSNDENISINIVYNEKIEDKTNEDIKIDMSSFNDEENLTYRNRNFQKANNIIFNEELNDKRRTEGKEILEDFSSQNSQLHKDYNHENMLKLHDKNIKNLRKVVNVQKGLVILGKLMSGKEENNIINLTQLSNNEKIILAINKLNDILNRREESKNNTLENQQHKRAKSNELIIVENILNHGNKLFNRIKTLIYNKFTNKTYNSKNKNLLYINKEIKEDIKKEINKEKNKEVNKEVNKENNIENDIDINKGINNVKNVNNSEKENEKKAEEEIIKKKNKKIKSFKNKNKKTLYSEENVNNNNNNIGIIEKMKEKKSKLDLKNNNDKLTNIHEDIIEKKKKKLFSQNNSKNNETAWKSSNEPNTIGYIDRYNELKINSNKFGKDEIEYIITKVDNQNKIKVNKTEGKNYLEEDSQSCSNIRGSKMKKTEKSLKKELNIFFSTLTADNFNNKIKKIFDLIDFCGSRNSITFSEKLAENEHILVKVIFNKAIEEQRNSLLLAKFCKEIYNNLLNEKNDNTKNSGISKEEKGKAENLKEFIKEECCIRFNSSKLNDMSIKNISLDASDIEGDNQYITYKKKLLGLINFLCDLNKVNIIEEKICFFCLENLFKRYNNEIKDLNDDFSFKLKFLNLEAFVKLTEKLAKITFENKNSKYIQIINTYINDDLFNIIQKKEEENNSKLPGHLKYKIIKLMEKFNNNWKYSPTKIKDEIKDANSLNNNSFSQIDHTGITDEKNNINIKEKDDENIKDKDIEKIEEKNKEENDFEFKKKNKGEKKESLRRLGSSSIQKTSKIKSKIINFNNSKSKEKNNIQKLRSSSNISQSNNENSNLIDSETIKIKLKKNIERYIRYMNNKKIKNQKGLFEKVNDSFNWKVVDKLIRNHNIKLEQIIHNYVEICEEIIDNKINIFKANKYIKSIIEYYSNDLSKNQIEILHLNMIELFLNIDNIIKKNVFMVEIMGNLLFILLTNKLYYMKDLNNFIEAEPLTQINIAKIVRYTILSSGKMCKQYHNDFKQTKLFSENKNEIFLNYVTNQIEKVVI